MCEPGFKNLEVTVQCLGSRLHKGGFEPETLILPHVNKIRM